MEERMKKKVIDIKWSAHKVVEEMDLMFMYTHSLTGAHGHIYRLGDINKFLCTLKITYYFS